MPKRARDSKAVKNEATEEKVHLIVESLTSETASFRR